MGKEELKNIWLKPIYLPYVQPDLTDEILKEAERKIGYKLPTEYVELLKVQNGGYIRYTLPNYMNEIISGIGPYFPSITDFNREEYQDYVSFELKGLVPFDGDGHWYLCLDYREDKEKPKITFIDTECDTQEIVANSFSEYIILLQLNIEDEFVIKTNKTIEEIKNQIEGILNIKFEEPDYYANGYANYRSKYRNSWIWLSPNKVPNGFVREDDDRYQELKLEKEEFALRYPEIDENFSMISFSDELLNDEIISMLKNKDVEIVSLKNLIK